MSTYGSVFMIDNVIYATKSYSESPTKIIYSFDLETNDENKNLSIDFENKGGYDSSLHYNWIKKQLWTINNQYFYTYDIVD